MMLMLEHVIIIINCERAIKEWSLTKNILAIMVVIPLLSLWYFCWPATLTMDNFNIILMLHSNFAHTNLVHAYPIWNSSAVEQVRVINKPNKPCALTEYVKSVHFWLEGGFMHSRYYPTHLSRRQNFITFYWWSILPLSNGWQPFWQQKLCRRPTLPMTEHSHFIPWSATGRGGVLHIAFETIKYSHGLR